MGNETIGVRQRVKLLLCSALIAVTVACSVQGVPIAPPPPTDGQVDVTIALTDSFDVLPGGRCVGRHLNAGVRDGAEVMIRGLTVHGPTRVRHEMTATMSARYVEDVSYLNADGSPRRYDDGKYCVVHVTFVPKERDGQGYEITLQTAPKGGTSFGQTLYSYWSDEPGGRGYGSFHFTVQTCADTDAPPERSC